MQGRLNDSHSKAGSLFRILGRIKRIGYSGLNAFRHPAAIINHLNNNLPSPLVGFHAKFTLASIAGFKGMNGVDDQMGKYLFQAVGITLHQRKVFLVIGSVGDAVIRDLFVKQSKGTVDDLNHIQRCHPFFRNSTKPIEPLQGLFRPFQALLEMC